MKLVQLFISFLLFFTVSTNVLSQDINWVSLQEAETLQQDDPKKLMVFFETSWCGYCKKMKSTVFKDADVINYLNENYYPVKFDAESKTPLSFDGIEYSFDADNGRRGAHELAIDMLQGYMAYPSVVFLDEDFVSIRKLMGLQPVELFSTFLKYVNEDAYESQDWFEYSGQTTSN